jgi:hypothetical protein
MVRLADMLTVVDAALFTVLCTNKESSAGLDRQMNASVMRTLAAYRMFSFI